MATPTLKALLSQKTGTLPILQSLVDALGAEISIEGPSSTYLLGERSAGASRVPVRIEDVTLGFVNGPPAPAAAIAIMARRDRRGATGGPPGAEGYAESGPPSRDQAGR